MQCTTPTASLISSVYIETRTVRTRANMRQPTSMLTRDLHTPQTFGSYFSVRRLGVFGWEQCDIAALLRRWDTSRPGDKSLMI